MLRGERALNRFDVYVLAWGGCVRLSLGLGALSGHRSGLRHLLTCIWYWVGNVPDGWVQEQELRLGPAYFSKRGADRSVALRGCR